MEKRMDFQSFLEYKSDEIDNAAYALAVALLRQDPFQTNEAILPWDISVTTPIVEAAKNILEQCGKKCCWPFYEDTIPCSKTKSCTNKNCYLDMNGGMKTNEETGLY